MKSSAPNYLKNSIAKRLLKKTSLILGLNNALHGFYEFSFEGDNCLKTLAFISDELCSHSNSENITREENKYITRLIAAFKEPNTFNNDTVVLSVSASRHAVGLAFYKNFLIYTNTGDWSAANPGTVIFDIGDKYKKLPNVLEKYKQELGFGFGNGLGSILRHSTELSELSTFLLEFLNQEQLDIIDNRFFKNIEELSLGMEEKLQVVYIKSQRQKTGNCTKSNNVKNIKGLLLLYFADQQHEKSKPGTMLSIQDVRSHRDHYFGKQEPALINVYKNFTRGLRAGAIKKIIGFMRQLLFVDQTDKKFKYEKFKDILAHMISVYFLKNFNAANKIIEVKHLLGGLESYPGFKGIVNNCIIAEIVLDDKFTFEAKKKQILPRISSADINYQDYYHKDTLLMLAANQGDSDMMQFLIEQGANTALKNKDNNTAFDLAKDYGDSGICGSGISRSTIIK